VDKPGRTFLVECYLPGVVESDVAAASERARRAAEELRNGGRDVAYLGALFVAIDEAVFHQFRALDAGLVVEASRMADLHFERVVESIGVDGGGLDVGDVDGAGAIETAPM
jgi:hypothetical protein